MDISVQSFADDIDNVHHLLFDNPLETTPFPGLTPHVVTTSEFAMNEKAFDERAASSGQLYDLQCDPLHLSRQPALVSRPQNALPPIIWEVGHDSNTPDSFSTWTLPANSSVSSDQFPLNVFQTSRHFDLSDTYVPSMHKMNIAANKIVELESVFWPQPSGLIRNDRAFPTQDYFLPVPESQEREIIKLSNSRLRRLGQTPRFASSTVR